jgi:hypothetical protein
VDKVVITLKVLGVFAIIIAFIGVLIWGSVRTKTINCERKAEGLEVEGRWTMFGGCRILVDGRWVPIENVRVKL